MTTTLVPQQPVSLLPANGGRIVHGVVAAVAGPGGPNAPGDTGGHPHGTDAAAARIRLDAGVAALLRDEAVYVSSRTPDERLRVHEAVAHVVDGDRSLVDLTDLRLIGDERRRAHLRAATQAPVLLVEPGRRSRGTTTIDLSAGGCRVVLAYGQTLQPGQILQVALDVDAGATIWADGEVVRVDEVRHEAALRFTRLDPSDSERVERRLLRSLSGAR